MTFLHTIGVIGGPLRARRLAMAVSLDGNLGGSHRDISISSNRSNVLTNQQ